MLALQQQPHPSLPQHPAYSVASSPLPSPTTMSDFRQLQINPQPLANVMGPSSSSTSSPTVLSIDGPKRGNVRKENVSSVASPANSVTSTKAIAASSSNVLSHLEDKSLDGELDEYDPDQEGSKNSNNPIEDLSQDDPDYAQKLAAEEDKRRRNTAASARFRHKKRLREQILEKTAKEMTAKSEILEVRVRELEMEIKWLRGLIVEKDSRMLDSLPAISSTSTSTANTAASLTSTSASALSSTPSLASLRGGTKAEGATATKRRNKKAPQA
jgi:hypothetical protein